MRLDPLGRLPAHEDPIESTQRILACRLSTLGRLLGTLVLVGVVVVIAPGAAHDMLKPMVPHHPICTEMAQLDRYALASPIRSSFAGVVPGLDRTDSTNGALLVSHLPENPYLSDIAERVWKIILRRWWGAWTDGLRVLEPRRWWSESGRTWCWLSSPSRTALRPLPSSEVASSPKLATTASELHARGLAHGGLDEGFAFTGTGGELVAPPTLDLVLRFGYKAREKRDWECLGTVDPAPDTPESLTHTGLELMATLQGEEVAAYEMVYPFSVKDATGDETKPGQELTILLDRAQPHPVFGRLNRATAAALFESLLRESNGERLELVANDSPDPFEYKGSRVVILSSPDEDEDALIVRPLEHKPFPQRGWVRPRSEGTRTLVERKRAILRTAGRKRHIIRWFGGKAIAHPKPSRETLGDSIVENEGIYCVQGPPGTGKTHLACDVVEAWLRRDPHARILVCAKEHNALHLLRNRVLTRLGDSAPQHSTVERATDSTDPSSAASDSTFSSTWARELVRRAAVKEFPASWVEALKRWEGQAPPILSKVHQRSSQLLFSTTTAAAVHEELVSSSSEPFDLAVVEEAGKCYPSELLSVLAQGRNALLIGDQKQLPPFQADEVSAALNDIERLWGEEEGRVRLLAHNPVLFERVQGTPEFSWSSVGSLLLPFKHLQEAGCPSFMLSDQYRMVPVLSDLVSSIFYPHRFNHKRPREECSPLFHHPALHDSPLVWIDVPHSRKEPQAREDRTGERFSEIELSTVAAIIRELRAVDRQRGSLAILSPYNAQVDRLAGRSGIPSRLPAKTESLGSIDPRANVRTVDSFQGNEADLVILSLVRNNPFGTARNAWGFLVSPERLNVMLSRARRQLVIVGCAEHVRRHAADPEMEHLVAVLRYVEQHGTIVPVDELGVRI